MVPSIVEVEDWFGHGDLVIELPSVVTALVCTHVRVIALLCMACKLFRRCIEIGNCM